MSKKGEFCVYKGEEVVAVGSAEECAKKLNVTKKSIMQLATPKNLRRIAKREDSSSALIAVRVKDVA